MGTELQNEVLAGYVNINHSWSDDRVSLCIPNVSHFSVNCKFWAYLNNTFI